MSQTESEPRLRAVARRTVALYMGLAALLLAGVAAIFLGAGLTAGEDQAGVLTFALISAAFAVPALTLLLVGVVLWRGRD